MDTTSIFRWAITCIALIVIKSAIDKVLSLRTALARIKDYPGCRLLWINPFSTPALVLGTSFPRPGMMGYYAGKFTFYKQFGSTVYGAVSVLNSQHYFWLADAEAIKLVTSDRHTFQKDVESYDIIEFCGPNLVTVEGSDWKRHRSVAMSAFSEANVAMVWSETFRVVNEWFEELDATNDGPDMTLDLLLPMTQVTLVVIVAAAFGRQISWTDDSSAKPPPGCQLTFRSAVLNSVNNLLFRALVPEWFYGFSLLIKVPYLSSRALLTRLAFQDLRTHMLDLVASARADITSGKGTSASGAALLRNLVEANMNQDGDSKRLAEGELLSNIFAFLLAGHETSAHTLCFAFALLALYPDCQQKLYEEVTRVWAEDVPVAEIATNHKEYLDQLEYTTAFFRETLRVFPVEPRICKDVHADAVLPGTYFHPGSKQSPTVEAGKFSVAVPAGSGVVMDIWGLHLNPLYWGDDADEFRPERFIDSESYQWPRNAFLPFSGGARSCIGQRFALAESVCILASVVRRYRILVPDDLATKSHGDQKEALLKWTTGITLTPVNARLKLCRRV